MDQRTKEVIPMRTRHSRFLSILMVVVAALCMVLVAPSGFAGSQYFNVASGDYATAGNWTAGGIIPGNGNNEQPWIGSAGGAATAVATYSTGTGYTTTDRFIIGLGASKSGTLTMSGSAGTLTFGGDTYGTANYIGVDGGTGVLNVDAGTLTFNSGAYLRIGGNGSGANGTLNIGGGTVNANYVVVARGSVVNAVTGAIQMTDGTFNLSNLALADTGTGQGGGAGGTAALTVSGGTVAISGWTYLGNSSAVGVPTATFSLSGGGEINASGDFAAGRYSDVTSTQTGGSLNILGTARLLVGASATSTSTYDLSGTGAIDISSTSYNNHGLYLGASGATSTFSLDGGTLTAPQVTAGTGSETFNFNGGTLEANKDNTSFMTDLSAADVENGGAIIDDGGFDITIGQALLNGGSGGLTKKGSGTLTLSGASTYIGATDVEAGTLTVNGGSLSGGGFIDIGATAGTAADFALVAGSVTAGSQFVVGAHGANSLATMDAGTLQVNGRLYLGGYGEGTGTGTFTQSGGTNTVTILVNFGGNGPNSGIYNLAGGTLITPSFVKDGSGTATFNFNGGTLKPSASSASFMTGLTAANVNADSTIDTAGFDITIAQALLVGSGGGLTKTGAGTLTLSGANTFTGDIVVEEGTLTDSRQVNSATPTATGLGNMMTEGRQIQVNTNGTLLFTANDPLGNATYYSPVDIVVNGGTVSHGTKFVTVGDIVLQNGGELTGGNGVNASYQTFNVMGSVTVSGNSASVITTTGSSHIGLHLGNGGFVVNETGDDVDLTVEVPLINKAGGATGSLTKSGAGTMRMTAVNTFSGDVTVSGGTLSIAQDNTIADGADVLISAGAKLDLDGGINDTVDELYLGGVLMHPGVWGSESSGATYPNDTYFSGTGVLTVTQGPRGSLFKFR